MDIDRLSLAANEVAFVLDPWDGDGAGLKLDVVRGMMCVFRDGDDELWLQGPAVIAVWDRGGDPVYWHTRAARGAEGVPRQQEGDDGDVLEVGYCMETRRRRTLGPTSCVR